MVVIEKLGEVEDIIFNNNLVVLEELFGQAVVKEKEKRLKVNGQIFLLIYFTMVQM